MNEEFRCHGCFYYRKNYPFDTHKKEYHLKWDFCAIKFTYLHPDTHQILKPTQSPIQNGLRLAPLDLSKFIQTWRGVFRWVPFDPNECKDYMPIQKAISILLR